MSTAAEAHGGIKIQTTPPDEPKSRNNTRTGPKLRCLRYKDTVGIISISKYAAGPIRYVYVESMNIM